MIMLFDVSISYQKRACHSRCQLDMLMLHVKLPWPLHVWADCWLDSSSRFESIPFFSIFEHSWRCYPYRWSLNSTFKAIRISVGVHLYIQIAHCRVLKSSTTPFCLLALQFKLCIVYGLIVLSVPTAWLLASRLWNDWWRINAARRNRYSFTYSTDLLISHKPLRLLLWQVLLLASLSVDWLELIQELTAGRRVLSSDILNCNGWFVS